MAGVKKEKCDKSKCLHLEKKILRGSILRQKKEPEVCSGSPGSPLKPSPTPCSTPASSCDSEICLG